ncbi:MAG: DUF2807 domain-containing protein [Fimbriimonadaceae bacterium]|nr:DUF2807 domain-containing protein [Fimbriimonadaceae bacterium]
MERMVLLAGLLVTVGCAGAGKLTGVPPSGKAATVTTDVAAFHSVVMDSPASVELVQAGKGEKPSVTVSGDEAHVKLFEAQSSGGKLVLKIKGSIQNSDLRVRVVCTEPLTSIECESPGSLKGAPRLGTSFEVTNDGVAAIELTGEVDELVVDSNGVGALKLGGLKSKTAKVTLDGVGAVEVYASESVAVSANGVGSVKVLGNPKQRAVSKDGIGEVRFD